MARVFLSCVSNEFLGYRELLTQQLLTAGVRVIVQEHLADTERPILERLDESVRESDVVVHLVGLATGSRPKDGLPDCPSEVDQFLSKRDREEFLRTSGLAPHAAALSRVSYTQWEYWLARAYKKPCLIYHIDPTAEREKKFVRKADEEAEQAAHLNRIRHTFDGRASVGGAWHLATRVMVSLIRGGTLAVPDEHGPPAIVLGFRLVGGGYVSSGALRWKGRTVPLALPETVPLTPGGDKRPAKGAKRTAAEEADRAVCARVTDLLHRGNRALADENILVRSVVELVLPVELLSRRLRDWKYTHEVLRCPVPICDWHPVRVRLAGREVKHTGVQNIRARLELLREHQHRLERVCRQVPAEYLTSSSARPLGVVHEGGKGCWHPVAVVCVWFSAPPPAVRPRKPSKNPNPSDSPLAGLIESELFKAVFDGVPFLVWPDAPPAGPADLAVWERELTAMPRPADLCEHLERRPFVVFAESKDPPFPDAEEMKSDVISPGGP